MPQSHRVRLADGSVIDLDRSALRSWYEKGLIGNDTRVQTPGSREWTRLADAMDVRQWRAPAKPVGRAAPVKPAARTTSPRAAAPRPSPHFLEALPWRKYATLALVAAVVVGALAWTSRWWFPALFGSEEERRVRAATLSERQFVDDGLGLRLELPRGWFRMKEDHGFFIPPPNARLSLAEPSAGAFAYLLVDTPARGFASLDAYLTQVLEERRRSEPSLLELRREDVRGKGRRTVATRQAGEATVEEDTSAWKDGWTYYALVVWAPAERASTAAASLLEGFTTQGHMGDRLRQAVETVCREVPLLTPAAAEMLMGQSAAQILEPAESFRRTYLLAGRGLAYLGKAEQKEMGTLTSELYGRLPRAADRQRLGSYIDRVRSGRATDPQLDQEMSQLVKGAVLKLPPARRQRLQALFEKALAAGVDAG